MDRMKGVLNVYTYMDEFGCGRNVHTDTYLQFRPLLPSMTRHRSCFNLYSHETLTLIWSGGKLLFISTLK